MGNTKQNVFTGCVALPFLNYDNSNVNINNLNQISEVEKGPVFQQVLCFCRERPRPWSTQQLHFLVSPHLTDSSQRPYDTCMIESFCTVSGFTLKSTHMLFCYFFWISTAWRYKCLAMSFRLPRLTDATPNSPVQRGNPSPCTLFSLLNTPHVDTGVFFFLPKFFFSAVLWNLISGWQCVHQGSHHSSCADMSPFTGFCSSKFIVPAGWLWVPTGPYSGSLCRIGSLCSKQGPSMMKNVDLWPGHSVGP